MSRHDRRAASARRADTGRKIQAAARKRRAGFFAFGKYHKFATAAELAKADAESVDLAEADHGPAQLRASLDANSDDIAAWPDEVKSAVETDVFGGVK